MDWVDIFLKVAPWGGPGVVIIALWVLSDKAAQRALLAYREDTLRQTSEHAKALSEMREMYKNNVELVKSYQSVAAGLQDLIVLNTRTITSLCEEIKGNQYCPQVRLRKEAIGRQG